MNNREALHNRERSRFLFLQGNRYMAGEIEVIVSDIITPLLEREGYELVAVETAGNRKNQILRLLIHKQGGLSVQDCKVVDQAVRPVLEVHQILDDYKQFEIASPGIDRPLTTIRDFQRNIGRSVKIETTPPNGHASEVQGLIKNVVDECIVLELASGKNKEIDITQVCKGYIQLTW